MSLGRADNTLTALSFTGSETALPRRMCPSLPSFHGLTVCETHIIFLKWFISNRCDHPPAGTRMHGAPNNFNFWVEEAHTPLINNYCSVKEKMPRCEVWGPGTSGQKGHADGVSWGPTSSQSKCANYCISRTWQVMKEEHQSWFNVYHTI